MISCDLIMDQSEYHVVLIVDQSEYHVVLKAERYSTKSMLFLLIMGMLKTRQIHYRFQVSTLPACKTTCQGDRTVGCVCLRSHNSCLI